MVHGRNFGINQRLLRIVESKDAQFTDYVGQILNEKLNEIKSVTRSEASSQQGGEPKVNLNNLYQTSFMKKTKEDDIIVLEKITLAEKYKNIKELRPIRRSMYLQDQERVKSTLFPKKLLRKTRC